MFIFVFYFQGAQGDSPITAGVSYPAGARNARLLPPGRDLRRPSRLPRSAALGMLFSAAGLAAMTTLQVHSPYWQSTLWLAIVGVGSGMSNSPNTAAMMGSVPAHRRGVAAGARTLLQNTGAVLSIAFVLAIVTSAVPKSTLFAVFSGLAKGLSAQRLAPFIDNMHVALWVLAATSLVGAGVCLLRPAHSDSQTPGPEALEHPARPRIPPPPGAGTRAREQAGHPCPLEESNRMTAEPPSPERDASMRIGDVARLVGTTPRTIRYYEEIGLLAQAPARPSGQHRLYSEDEVERLREVMRLKDLLGVSLEELKTLLAAEEARAEVRAQLRREDVQPERRRELLLEALGHIERQLELVRHRASELDKLQSELATPSSGASQDPRAGRP